MNFDSSVSSGFEPFGRTYASWLNGFIACIVCESESVVIKYRQHGWIIIYLSKY